MKDFPFSPAKPPSPAAPANPTPSPPLSGEGREHGLPGADETPGARDQRQRKRRGSAPPVKREGVGVGESHWTPRPPDWRPSPRARRLAPDLRRNTTEAEKELWWHLRRKLPLKGTHFRRQVPIGPFIVDFCCHGHGLIVELDGGQHSDDSALIRDERRDRYLRAHGYRVLRFWNAQVFTEIEAVIDTIAAALLDSRPPPPPPVSREGRGRAP
jgi:very-short-patch-repair endonuclease